ncbi:MAG: hypothetical protein AAF830_17000 [Pseudomonadota bacterium]
MGKMSELQIELHQEQAVIHSRWNEILTDLIRASGYSLVEANEPPDGYDEDEWAMYDQMPYFTLRTADGRHAAVELKIYRWQSDWKNHLKNAIDHIATIIKAKPYDEGILIVTWDIDSPQFKTADLRLPTNIKLWDLGDLRKLSEREAGLQQALNDLIDETVMHADFVERVTVSIPRQNSSELEGSIQSKWPPDRMSWRRRASSSTHWCSMRFMLGSTSSIAVPQTCSPQMGRLCRGHKEGCLAGTSRRTLQPVFAYPKSRLLMQ